MFIRKCLILLLCIVSFNLRAGDTLSLTLGDAQTINVSSRISTVFVSNPEIADYKVIDSQTVVVYGKSLGTSALVVYGASGKELFRKTLLVNSNVAVIKKVLRDYFPDEIVTVTISEENILLTGTVSNEDVKSQIYNIVGELLGKRAERQYFSLNSEDSGSEDRLFYTEKRNYVGLVNNLKVISTNQINVKVTIAEVSNSFLTNLGVSYGSENTSSGVFVDKLLDFSAQDIVSVIEANGNDSIGQILAEPNLTVFSGEQASFLVGGEIPIAIRDNDGISISYKEYGIRLAMVAKVIDNDNIRLTLTPEVSSLDETNQTSTGLVSIPSLKTRRALTTVQLKNGQSFILAGLLSSQDQEALSKIPYLGDIPILGALFSRTTSSRSKTELIIVATVNFVEPVSSNDIKLPKFNETSDLERLFRVDFSNNENSQEVDEILSDGGFS